MRDVPCDDCRGNGCASCGGSGLKESEPVGVLSEEGLAHLRALLLHRPDIDLLRVEVLPGRCRLCGEILAWAEQVRDRQEAAAHAA